MKPLTLEIHGTGTHNRGAELMAIAIKERMQNTFPGVRIVVPPQFGDFITRAKHGFWSSWDFSGRLRAKVAKAGFKYSLPSVRESLGVVDPAEVDAVLDASGFFFSDQWGPAGVLDLLRKMNRPERRNQRLILLPQALGTFKNPEVARPSRELFGRADLVCARDEKSLEAAKDLGGAKLLKKYPDFTLGVRPLLPSDLEIPERFAAIVPNYRMLDKSGSADAYLQFLKQAIISLQEKGMNPLFVLHDAEEDRKILPKDPLFGTIPVLQHEDPRVLKAILGRADLVLGSRFHALVSSFSQGVPCIGAGWSHKYPELFRDFDAEDLLISDMNDLTRQKAIINELADLSSRKVRSARIQIAATQLKELTCAMWEDVESILRSKIPSLQKT